MTMCLLAITELVWSHVDEKSPFSISYGDGSSTASAPARRLSLPLSADKFLALIENIDTFIFDADGVLWLGDDVIAGSPETIQFLVQRGKRVLVLTNNATKSRRDYAAKLTSLGYDEAINRDTIINPAAVIADILSRAALSQLNKKVYLIGAKGVRDELDDVNIEYFGFGPEPEDTSDGSAFMFDIDLQVPSQDVGAVVVGYEKHFNYHKLMIASNYLQDERCLFMATNEDETCPGPNKSIVVPDAGPIVAAVKSAASRTPLTVGKPNTPAFEFIKRRWKIIPSRTMMVGDRLNTDIKFGRDHGLKTLLVLSGCHQLTDIYEKQRDCQDDLVPDYYAPCLGSLRPHVVE